MKLKGNFLVKKVLVFALAAIMLHACKEPEGIGLDVLPGGQEIPVAWIDTFTVEARSVFDSAIVTSNLPSGDYLIGDFGDPIFGRVTSSLFTQFHLPSSNVEFGDSIVLDSVVLNLAYSGAYGYTDKLRGTMKFGVFELEDDIDDGEAYSSDQEWNVAPLSIGEMEFRPDLFSEVFIGDDTVPLPPSLRIPLDSDFGERILNSTSLASNEAFLADFKGINIRSTSANTQLGTGSILYFDMVSEFSRVELFYHDSNETYQLNLEINNDCATHTVFSHTFLPEIINAVADSTITGSSRLYVQSMAGVKMKIDIPFLKNLNELGVVAINKAELIVPLDETVDEEHEYPSFLAATAIDSDGNSVFLADAVEPDPSYGGGVLIADEKEYVFNIARQLQSVLSAPDEPDYGLYILNTGNAINAKRGVFNGPSHPTDSMKIRLTYSIIEP